MLETALLADREPGGHSAHIEESYLEHDRPFVVLEKEQPSAPSGGEGLPAAKETVAPQLLPNPPELGDEKAQLVTEHWGLVAEIVRRFVRKGASRHINDLESDAQLGLMDAASRYDPSDARGAPFRAYAASRIAGAILDGNRSYFGRYNQKPTSLLRDYVSLDVAVGTKVDTPLGELLPHKAPTPEEVIIARNEDMEIRLHRAISTLPERDQRIVREYYFEERTMKDIGAGLGVSESRISQIVKGALKNLRGALIERT